MTSLTTVSDFLKTYEPRKIFGRRLFIRSMIDELRHINDHILNGSNIRRNLFVIPKLKGF